MTKERNVFCKMQFDIISIQSNLIIMFVFVLCYLCVHLSPKFILIIISMIHDHQQIWKFLTNKKTYFLIPPPFLKWFIFEKLNKHDYNGFETNFKHDSNNLDIKTCANKLRSAIKKFVHVQSHHSRTLNNNHWDLFSPKFRIISKQTLFWRPNVFQNSFGVPKLVWAWLL